MQREVIFIGSRLQKIREKNSITVRALADYLETSEDVIRYYEQGIRQPNTGSLALLANFLGVPMEYFIEIVEKSAHSHFRTDHKESNRGDLKTSHIKRPAHLSDPSLADLPLHTLDMSSRTRNALIRSGCVTVQDAYLMIECGQTFRTRNFGIVSLKELLIAIYKLTGADLRDCYSNLCFPEMDDILHHNE